MPSLAETIRIVTTGKKLTEADAVPAMQANQPVDGVDPSTLNTGNPNDSMPEKVDIAGQQVIQAELILISDRAQKIAALVSQFGMTDPMIQTQITSIASDISQLYADLMLSMTPDPNTNLNASQNGQQANRGSQVNTNPKVAEESEITEIFGIKANQAVIAAANALKKKPTDKKPELKMPGIRLPQDRICRENTVDEAVVPKPINDEDDANEHIIMQLHKAVTLGGKKIVKFASGQKVKVDPKTAFKAIQKYGQLKPLEKQKAQEYIRQSHNNLMDFVKEDFVLQTIDKEELEERVIQAEPHFIDRLEASIKTPTGKEIEFENGQSVIVPPNIARKIVDKFKSLPAYEKQKLQKYVRFSYANLIRAARS